MKVVSCEKASAWSRLQDIQFENGQVISTGSNKTIRLFFAMIMIFFCESAYGVFCLSVRPNVQYMSVCMYVCMGPIEKIDRSSKNFF